MAGACGICGATPTTSNLGICSRTAACRRAYQRKWHGYRGNDRVYSPCEVCSRLTASDYGVCYETEPCKREWRRRRRLADKGPPPVCEMCGGPMARSNVSGVCSRNPECRREGNRRTRDAEKQREYDRQRYATSDKDRNREKARAWRAANPGKIRGYTRKRLQRTDRPCKHAAEGCADLAMPNSHYCRTHARAAFRRWYNRQAAKLKQRLADGQDGLCTWCGKPLPTDLSRVHVDHVIPKASGVIVEDEWNLRALHARCNVSKGSQITADAIELAASHGMTLPPATLTSESHSRVSSILTRSSTSLTPLTTSLSSR